MLTPAKQSAPPTSPALPTGNSASSWTLVRRLLGIGWQYRAKAITVILLQALLLALNLAGLALVGVGIDFIHHTVDPAAKPPQWPLAIAPPDNWSPMHTVLIIGLAIILLATSRSLLTFLATILQGSLIQDIVVGLRAKVYDKLQRLSFRFFDANETGSIINRVTGDVQNVRLFVDGVIIQLVILLLSLSIYLFYMLRIHATLTLWCLASTPFLALLALAFSRLVKPAYLKSRRLSDKMILTLSENLQGIHVVKGFAREQQEIQKFSAASLAVHDQQRWIFKRLSFFTASIGFLTHANLVVLLAYGGHLYAQNQVTIGQGLVVFAVLLQQFSAQVATLANIANSIQQSLIGAQRVFEVLDSPVEIQSPHKPVRIQHFRGAIRFENVSFAYKDNDPVLQNISFSVQPGACVAILGATGSGKSTLLSLIPRFYDPQQGRVLIDDIDVRNLDLDALRRSVGTVFQESFLFSNTVAANISFGHPNATHEQIETAAKIAAAHDFIMELPRGYDTYIGERGSGLSGGQKQRLAIARALLLQPAILLLDDPTAAIDPQTEHQIIQAMESAMKCRTTFIVAHRLSTLRAADLVLVLEQGRIVQTGTHDQLMAQKGAYHRAAKLQIADAHSLALLGISDEGASP